MAQFCSECGGRVTERMLRCPQCGAEILGHKGEAPAYIPVYSMPTATHRSLSSFTIGAGIAMCISTIFSWYGISFNIDGGGGLDAMMGMFTSILPGHPGISTIYGMICFAMAVALIVSAACKSRLITMLIAIGCLVVTVVAILDTPSFAELIERETSGGPSLIESLSGGPIPMFDDSHMRTAGNIVEAGSQYVNVEIGYGLYIALMSSIAAAILALVDMMRNDNKAQ